MPTQRHDARGGCSCASHSARAWNRPEHWTAQEIAYLEQWYGWKPDAELAEHLGRSPVGITIKAKRLGLRKKDAGYTAREVGRLFGIDAATVSKIWIRRGLLRAHSAYSAGLKPVHLVEHSEIERFVFEHGQWVDHTKVPIDSPFADAVGANRWYSLAQVHALTGRQNIATEIRAGLIPARKKGAHWMVPETALPRIRRLDPTHITESVRRKRLLLDQRRDRRRALRAAS